MSATIAEFCPTDQLLREFSTALSQGLRPSISDYLPEETNPEQTALLAQLIRLEMNHLWAEGEPIRLTQYVERFPELKNAPTLLHDLAFEEYCQRIIAGQNPSPMDYQRAYGVDASCWPREEQTRPITLPTSEKDHPSIYPTERQNCIPLEEATITRMQPIRVGCEIERERSSHQALVRKLDRARAALPKVGEKFLGFELIHQLGEGGYGRVYLARQESLAGRLVALKVAVDLGAEPQQMAKLQHTNIMPIYSEHHTENLHAVCMPYFGCTTLADICHLLRSSKSLPISGKDLVSTLHDRQSTIRSVSRHSSISLHQSSLEPTPVRTPIPDTLRAEQIPINGELLNNIGQMSYIDAILWIGQRMAAGLAHAHQRGIIHRDLKPANVLLTDEGEPMLLDFNLAIDTSDTFATIAKAGGTLPYMSPEQLRSLSDRSIVLDGRSDIYSLGLILWQLLAGKNPFPLYKGKSTEIVPKMLRDRYEPLPSLRSLNPGVTPAVEAIVLHCLQPDPARRYATAEQVLEDIEAHRLDRPLRHIAEPSFIERIQKFSRRNPRLFSPAALGSLACMILLVAGIVWSQQMYHNKQRMLDAHRLMAVDRYQEFQQYFHRAEYLLSTDDPEQLLEGIREADRALAIYRVFEDQNWKQQLTVEHLPPDDRHRLNYEVGELAYLMARTVAQHEGMKNLNNIGTKMGAKQLHEVASELLPQSEQLVLAIQKADLEGKQGTADYLALRSKLQQIDSLMGRVPYLIASEYVSQGRYPEALKLLKAAIEKDPEDFGSWYLKARCHHMLEQELDALSCYSVCIGLRPRYPRPYHARACLLYARRRNLEQARADLDQSLKLQPNFLLAYVDRALVLHAMGKHKEALDDLDWALSCRDVPKRVWFIRAIVREAIGDKEGAQKDREEGLKQEPTDAISYVSRGIVRLDQDARGALRDFEKAEELNPRCSEALFNQVYVLGEKLHQTERALELLERYLERYPDSANGYAAKGIFMARLGRTDEAVAAAKRCLAIDAHPMNSYHAACIYALLSDKEPKYKQESYRLLADALKRGWGYDRLERDDDLNLLRKQPEFQRLVELVKTLQTLSSPPTGN